MVFPNTPVQNTKSNDTSQTSTTTTSPTSSEGSIHDPPGYIAPDQQDMLLTDITTKILHSDDMTLRVGHGIIKYLSLAEGLPGGRHPAQARGRRRGDGGGVRRLGVKTSGPTVARPIAWP